MPHGVPRRPALVPALGFCSGVVLGSVGETLAAVAPIGLLAATVFSNRWRAAFAVSALSLGIAVGVAERMESVERTRSLPRDGSPVERTIEGRLLGSPEARLDGDASVLVSVALGNSPDSAPARVLLRIRGGAHAESLGGLHHGDRIHVFAKLRRPATPGMGRLEDAPPGTGLAGIDVVGSVKSPRLVRLVQEGPFDIPRLADRIRVHALHRLDLRYGSGGPIRALAGAMLVGDRGSLDESEWRALRASGLVHLVSISGFHVMLVLAFTLVPLDRIGIGPWSTALLAICLIGLFALVVGPQASVLRATFGGMLWLFGRAIGRDGDPLNSLAVLAVALLLVDPSIWADIGFQLSFLATAALCTLSRQVRPSIPGPVWLSGALAASLSAYAATAPVIALQFRQVTPLGILANLVGIPLSAVFLASGYVSIGVPGLERIAAWICATSGTLIFDTARQFESLELHSRVGRPAPWLVAASFLALSLLAFRSERPVRGLPVSAIAFALLVLLHVGPRPPAVSGTTELRLLDVGQGQALWIRGPDGGSIVVDAGGSSRPGGFDPGDRRVVPALVDAGITRLDALVISHDDADHAAGAFAIVRSVEVAELWLGPGSGRSARLSALAALARRRSVAIVGVAAGIARTRAGLKFQVLAPRRNARGTDNDRSLVIRIGDGRSWALVPGDLGPVGERRLLDQLAELRADLLVVSHHGSRTGSCRALLRAVNPRLAWISAGRGNPFGHPHSETLSRLRASGARVQRTDREGDLEFVFGRSDAEPGELFSFGSAKLDRAQHH